MSLKDDSFYKTSKLDVVLIVVVMLFSAICIFWFMRGRFARPGAPKIVLVYQQDRLLEKIGLDKDRMFTLLNGQMQVEIRKGRIRVSRAECPQHVCMNMGWILYSGQTIVCVPNKVLIEIKSTRTPLVDAVSF